VATARDEGVAVAVGGAIGALARYAVGRAWPVRSGGFPWSTFVINTSGAFAIGWLLMAIGVRTVRWRHARPLLVTGFLGAWTTMSTFAVEVDLLARDGRVGVAPAYVLASAIAGVAATILGVRLARR
jgi:CrcB protein